jgi:hypothetical protein
MIGKITRKVRGDRAAAMGRLNFPAFPQEPRGWRTLVMAAARNVVIVSEAKQSSH